MGNDERTSAPYLTSASSHSCHHFHLVNPCPYSCYWKVLSTVSPSESRPPTKRQARHSRRKVKPVPNWPLRKCFDTPEVTLYSFSRLHHAGRPADMISKIRFFHVFELQKLCVRAGASTARQNYCSGVPRHGGISGSLLYCQQKDFQFRSMSEILKLVDRVERAQEYLFEEVEPSLVTEIAPALETRPPERDCCTDGNCTCYQTSYGDIQQHGVPGVSSYCWSLVAHHLCPFAATVASSLPSIDPQYGGYCCWHY
jgi:hypothetical protein